MRYVPVNCLRSGHSLASDIIVGKNTILLRKGVELTERLIGRLRTLGFQGIYIHDEISKDIQVESILSDQMKSAVKNELRQLYFCAQCEQDRRFHTHLNEMNATISDMVNEVLRQKHMLVNIIDLRTYDDYTFSHSLNVAVISVVVGSALGLSRRELHDLAMGSVLHDIGKIFIDKSIINKPARLTKGEYAAIQRHSVLGYQYTLDKLGSEKAKEIILTHHERYGGGGYPAKLHGESIPLFGRIVSVADVFDALTSDRPYRGALLPSDAFEYIMGQSGFQFEPKIVQAFTRKVAPYPVGTCIRLSNGETGIVVSNYESSGLRPVVRILHNETPTNEYIDLTRDASSLNITISEVINL